LVAGLREGPSSPLPPTAGNQRFHNPVDGAIRLKISVWPLFGKNITLTIRAESRGKQDFSERHVIYQS
jgi:hypothetical protein